MHLAILYTAGTVINKPKELELMHAVIYTKDNCPYCTKAKILMTNRGITYDEKLVNPNGPDSRELKENQSWGTREQLLEAAPTARTFPQSISCSLLYISCYISENGLSLGQCT